MGDRISRNDLEKKGYMETKPGVFEPAERMILEVLGEPEPKAAKRLAEPKAKSREPIPGTYVFNIDPMGKPSFQKSDKWKTANHPDPRRRQRVKITRYLAYRDELRRQQAENGLIIPEAGAMITFNIPMPKSWSKKKRLVSQFTGHKAKPDLDNLLKGLFDCLCPNKGKGDSYIYQYIPGKYWDEKGKITISF